MTKFFVALFFTIITSNFLFAQQDNLEVKGETPDLYVEHVVVPKESFYSVGRLYNLKPREIAKYNHLKLANGLRIGQHLKIPLVNNNFTQTGAVANGEVLVPVYHHVKAGETLYRLGVNYNKVPLLSLKEWNHLQSDELSVGESMIVGYLKVDKNQSSLASRKIAPITQIAIAAPTEEKPVEEKAGVVEENVSAPQEPNPAITENKDAVTAQTDAPKIPVTHANIENNPNASGGYFKNLYNQQVGNKSPTDRSGTAGVFKSTSGWQDKKYYCFNNEAAPGDVLKVTDKATGKSVYAKVLDAIPDIKQNEGLSVVISNSAAEELGANENRFDCVLTYIK